MGTDGRWDEEELKRFSEEFSKHKSLNLDCTLYTIFMTNSEVLCKMSRALNMNLSAYDMLQLCYSFREAAVKKMRTYIAEGGSWSDAWGAPQWIRSLEPSLAIIEKALEAEIAEGGRPMARVVSELAASARAALVGAAQPCQALRSGDVVRAFALARCLSADGLASLWCILYSESIRHMRQLWVAGDYVNAAGWPTGVCWDLVELALQYDTQLALITPTCFKAKKFANALTLLFELISREYSKIEEQERAKGGDSAGRDGGEPRLSRDSEQALWQRVHAEYTNSGRVVSPLALQRRWCGLRRLARDQLRPIARRRSPAHPLLLAVALRFPAVMAAEQPTWEQLVRRRRVYRLPAPSPVYFERPYSLEQQQSDPVEQETTQTIDLAPCIEVSDDDGEGDASRAHGLDVASSGAVRDTQSDVPKHNDLNCVKASNVRGSRDKYKNNILDEEAKSKSDQGTENRILYVDYEKTEGSSIQDINAPNDFINSLQNGDIPFLDVSIDLDGVPRNKTTRGAEPQELRACDDASSAVRALDSASFEPPPTVFNNGQIIVIPSLKITKIIVPEKTNICCRSTIYEKCNIKTTKSGYEAEDTETANNINKKEDTPAGCHDDLLVEMPTKSIDRGRQNISCPRRPEAAALDNKLMQKAEVIVCPLEYISMWRKFSNNGVINCRRISMRRFIGAGVGKRCRGALRRYAAGAVRGGTGVRYARARALAGALRLPALSQSFWDKNIAQLKMLKPVRVILKRLPSRKDGGAAGNEGVYEPEKRISVQKNDSRYPGMFKVTSATTDAPANLQRTDNRRTNEGKTDERQMETRQTKTPATPQPSIVSGVVADISKPVEKGTIKTSKSTVKQGPRKGRKWRPRVPAQPPQQLTPLEEWERQKNITRLYFDFPPRGGGGGEAVQAETLQKNMLSTEIEAPAVVHDASEHGGSETGQWNNDRWKMPKILEHVRNKNYFTVDPPAPADDDVIFVESTDGRRPADPAPVIVSVTSLADVEAGPSAAGAETVTWGGVGGGGGRPPDNELVVVKGVLPCAGQTANKPFEVALSLHRSVTVDEYASSDQSLVNPVFRLDADKPLRMLLGEYIVVTTDHVPIARPTYWTGGGMSQFACARICFPPETSAQYLEILTCECDGPSNSCGLCSAIASAMANGPGSAGPGGNRGETGARREPGLQEERGEPGARREPGLQEERGEPGARREPGLQEERGEPGAAKIKVKSFAKLPNDDDDEDTCPLTINSDGKTFRRTSSAPLVYRNIDNFHLDPELVSCKVINKVLFKRICGNNFVKVLTAVCEAAEVRRMARAGRPLLCSSFRTGEPPPPGLFRELLRVMIGDDRPHGPGRPTVPCDPDHRPPPVTPTTDRPR